MDDLEALVDEGERFLRDGNSDPEGGQGHGGSVSIQQLAFDYIT
jgi:hypothetical protein